MIAFHAYLFEFGALAIRDLILYANQNLQKRVLPV